jgi:hypothetical protein
MAQETWEAVWERVRAGKHVVVIGPGMLPAAPRDLQVFAMHCEALSTSGSVLHAVLRNLEHLLGQELQSATPGRGALDTGLRQRFSGDIPGQAIDALFVEACNRLARQTGGHTALALATIDAADEATLMALADIFRRPGWLQLPLILTTPGTPQGLVIEIIYLLCRDGDNEAVIEIAAATVAPQESAAPFDWTTLPAHVLRVLRAGSVLGATFEAELVARLLDEPLGTVLETLQWAADAGVPLADRGEGRFTLPPAGIEALQSRMLPSLLTFWHARLGDLLRHGQPAPDRAVPAQPVVGVPYSAPETVTPARQPVQAEARFTPPESSGAATTSATQPFADYAELFEAPQGMVPPETAPRADTARPAFSAQQTAAQAPPLPRAHGAQPRAAAHLQAAGQTEAAITQYLAAVQEAAVSGDARRAYSLAEQALKLFDNLPPSQRRALLRAQLLLEKGRLQWHGALLGAPFTLQEALASLHTARESLPDDAPPEVVGQVAAVIAGICYDLGDLPALQKALETLTESSRRLLEAGASLLATRLLNDQAAVYVRLGDPVRATHLLSKSHELFEGLLRQNPNDTVALEELAESDHLLARLPLHVQIRPGRETEAYASGLEHARAAERAYQRLGQQQQLTRVWETMGRLELQRGQLQAAQERLAAAFDRQRQMGDVTGLARSAAALADLFVRAGRPGEAIALLADSITLNFEKGSPIGLAFNRRAFATLSQAAAQVQGPEAEGLRGALREVESRLTQAEAVLGRLVLPGEAA